MRTCICGHPEDMHSGYMMVDCECGGCECKRFKAVNRKCAGCGKEAPLNDVYAGFDEHTGEEVFYEVCNECIEKEVKGSVALWENLHK